MPAIRRRWTAANVRALIDENRHWPRYELIDGELLVTPAPGSPHQFAVGEIAALLHEYLKREQVGLPLTSPADLELEADNITQPDVFVVPFETKLTGEYLSWSDVKSLLLAVEVVSPSSVRMDRVVKRDFYLRAGVPDYWVVDLDARVVERWTPAQETPEILRDRVVWSPASSSSPLIVDLPVLFRETARKARLIRI